MTPEAHARLLIDQKLAAAGWQVQDMKQINLGASQGVAVREYPTASGPADYVLFVDRNPVGVIEAKPDHTILTFAEEQTARYAGSALRWRMPGQPPLRFLFESTGQVIHFTDSLDPAPRARELFHFFRPAHLAELLTQPNTLRRRLATHMPALPERNLRDCQVSAVTGLEASLALNRPRALVHMATGAGKTFTAITSVYRLLKFGGAKRVLFLVDTRNLGKQAHQEFMAYTPPDDGRKFTELYNVQRLASSAIDPHAQVVISTIQRMYSVLSGEPIDESAEDVSLNEVQQLPKQAKLVRYNADLPVEAFDFIVIDECHRSIYNLWKQVLDYFDASLIGLTATPDETVLSLANRLVRLSKQLDDKAKARIEMAAGGVPVGELGKALIVALDPDRIAATAQARGITRDEGTLTTHELREARDQRVAAACAPFDQPELRDQIESARREREPLIDHINLDQVTFAGYSAQAEDEARKVIQTFTDYLAAHRDEIGALRFFYQQPYQRRALTFEMIEDLHEQLSRPPLMLTTERLWSAYARVHANRVKGADRQRQLTDLISLVRFTSGMDGEGAELKPFADEVDKRFADWVFRHNAQRATAFTPEQMDWLRLMKDHIASSCSIGRPHFNYAAFAAKGGLQKAWGVFGEQLDPLMDEMNLELVA